MRYRPDILYTVQYTRMRSEILSKHMAMPPPCDIGLTYFTLYSTRACAVRYYLSIWQCHHHVKGLTYCTVPKEIDFPRYNMKCSGENVKIRGIFHVLSCFPLYFILYRRNFDHFSDSVHVHCTVHGHAHCAVAVAVAAAV